ncbi:MAG: hypothetical protein GWN93_05945 [Deltaproteobacteria bacterium]|nr:hypothetical protein [Deltaproteobacteria bacterium]
MRLIRYTPDGKHYRGKRKKAHWRIRRRRKRKAQRRTRKMLRARLGRRYPK